MGVDRVVFPERDMGMRLAKSLLTPNVLELIDLSDEYQLVEIILPMKWVGNTIIGVDVRKKYGISILAIHRGGQFIVSPSPDSTFETGDIFWCWARRTISTVSTIGTTVAAAQAYKAAPPSRQDRRGRLSPSASEGSYRHGAIRRLAFQP